MVWHLSDSFTWGQPKVEVAWHSPGYFTGELWISSETSVSFPSLTNLGKSVVGYAHTIVTEHWPFQLLCNVFDVFLGCAVVLVANGITISLIWVSCFPNVAILELMSVALIHFIPTNSSCSSHNLAVVTRSILITSHLHVSRFFHTVKGAKRILDEPSHVALTPSGAAKFWVLPKDDPPVPVPDRHWHKWKCGIGFIKQAKALKW